MEEKYPYENIADTRELCRLADGTHNVLQIKKMLDTQESKESDLQDIINYLSMLKELGLITF
jgi:hypothetical protein